MVDAEKINRMIDDVRQKLQSVDVDRQKELDTSMALSLTELVKFQQLKSEAFLDGLIDEQAGQIIYVALGESFTASNGGWAAKTDLATKCIVTQFMTELLTRKLRARGVAV